MRAGARGLVEFLGLRRNVTLLLAAILLIGTGEELWMRFVPKYLEALGASVFLIGLYDALKTLLGAVYAYPGGVLTDRWGQRRALLVFTVASLAGYAVVLLVPHRAGVVLGMFLFLAWSNLSLPASFSLVASTLPSDKHAMGIGIQSLIKRVPIIAGPIAGGLLIDHLGIISGVRMGAAASLVFGCVAVVAQGALRKEPPAPTPQRSGLLGAVRGFRPELRRLLVSDILIRFCERIPAAWIVIHAMNHLGVSASQFGLLTAVEMIAKKHEPLVSVAPGTTVLAALQLMADD